ncbi:MAG: 5-(carboxyamino)imidazole ribonucleotide synthase [Pseudomonadota bacterium]
MATVAHKLSANDTIGIMGGGQLGRMLSMAAAKLGLRTVIFEPSEDCPAAQCANAHVSAPYDDADALRAFASQCQVVTFEFENVDLFAVDQIVDSVAVLPGRKALATSQDRLAEKRFLEEVGISTAEFWALDNPEQLRKALVEFGGVGIVKTRRFGYDGKGQVRVDPIDPASQDAASELVENSACILESVVDFDFEFSVIAARSCSGQFAVFDLPENRHEDGILRQSTVPSRLSPQQVGSAIAQARALLDALDYVGVAGVEFFACQDGSIVANEFAPRVHNSGHWTEAVCHVTQFEQHIRAIAGWPLGKIDRHSNCEMFNLIGDDVEKLDQLLGLEHAVLNLYGKQEVRPGRKMGHYTVLTPMVTV